MTFELTVLGSSSALPTSTKYPAAHVLNVHERFFLIDCGEGTQIQLRKARFRFGRINHIFISHLHGDHVFGLPGLLSSFDLLGRKTPLHLYGPPDLQIMLDFYLRNFAVEPEYQIILHPVSEPHYHKIFEDKVLEIYAFPLEHRIPTLGYHFVEKQRPLNIRKDRIEKYNLSIKQIVRAKMGEAVTLDNGQVISNAELTEIPYRRRSFAYCSDTAFCRKNASLIRPVDLLYHEATFLEEDYILAKKTGHSTAAQAGRFAIAAQAGQLVIGHFSNRYKDTGLFLKEAAEVFPDTREAVELQTYRIDLQKEPRSS